MLNERLRQILLVAAITGALSAQAVAQATLGEEIVDQFNAIFPIDRTREMTVSELCCRLDSLAKKMRGDGLVLVKQPDVFSQARMTRFRNDFENQMSSDLANFHLVLAARISRLDSATTTSSTALGAALAAPGTTNVQAPSAGSTSPAASLLNPNSGLFPAYTQPNLFGSSPPGAFNSLGVGSNTLAQPSAANAAALSLGVEPTVYLEEKQRFLNYLNHLRRLNLGPDQNDSSGYGLYLVRLPVSITPGECTYQGHGADLSMQVEHEFTPDFLPSAFRRLVINDLVDQLGPYLYEVIRSGQYENNLKPQLEATEHVEKLSVGLAEVVADGVKCLSAKPPNEVAETLARYILREELPWTKDIQTNSSMGTAIQYRRDALARYSRNQPPTEHVKAFTPYRKHSRILTFGPVEEFSLRTDAEIRQRVRAEVAELIANNSPLDDPSANRRFREFVQSLYYFALKDDIHRLDDLLGVDTQQRENITTPLATALDTVANSQGGFNNVNLPSSRTAKQSYPISPREILFFFGEDNIPALAREVLSASRTGADKTPSKIRSNEIRDYLRHLLDGAYDLMAVPTAEAGALAPPLADDNFMGVLHLALQQRNFEGTHETECGTINAGQPAQLEILNEGLIDQLRESRHNIRRYPIDPLCWAIAIDAALLNAQLKRDARRVFAEHGLPVEPVEAAHFYRPSNYCDDFSRNAFCEYVRKRWPIITFSLDPVTDQQNIADSFSLNRDLQLAASFAFASGQINFSQLNSFRRQIQQSSDAIALNRTITGFMQSNDTFGFRFTPRFQNPPNQRTNIGVIASQLIWGGPPPNYQIRKSKLEPGVREISAVLLIPTFLPVMRVNVSTNWFKLTDPEHLVNHTGRMMERGRQVQELRERVQVLCNAHEYRESDLRVLKSKMDQLDTMLPMQSRLVQLPFENSAAGFDLFLEGSAALVPELTGFTGVDVITLPSGTSASNTSGATAAAPNSTGSNSTTTASTTSPASFSITSLASPNQTAATTTYTIAGGSTAIADIFVLGKYISLMDTRVIAGGRVASFEILSREVVHVQIPSNVISTTTEDGTTYVELYLATPNGISNSLLIPCIVPSQTATKTKVAYDVGTTPALDIYYQWFAGPDGKATLAPSADPSKNAVTITWDSDTGLAPRQIQVQFAATVNNQNVVIELPATASTSGDYKIDGTIFTTKLLDRLQSITVYPAIPTTTVTFTVTVLPWTPADPQGLRAITKPKTLPTKLTVNMNYNAVGHLPPPKPGAGGAAGTSSRLMAPSTLDNVRLGLAVGSEDPAVVRTAQGLGLPSIPSLPSLPSVPSQAISSFLQAPQPPPPLSMPTLLAPNVASEAEQISKLISGQPTATAVTGPNQQGLAAFAPAVTSQAPTVIVNPAPVTVVAPPGTTAKKKHTSAVHKALNRLGNRISSAVPSQ